MSDIQFKETEHGRRCGDVEIVWAKNSKTFFFANSLVIHGEQPWVVDPSANFTYFDQMAASGKTIRVLNTHYHTDHRALNGLFKKAVYHCHEADASALRSWDHFQRCLDRNADSPYSEWVRRMWQQMNLRDTPVTVELQDGDTLTSERGRAVIVHLPGHTPGHSGLYFPEIRFLFTADIDLTPMGPWYANEVSDLAQFRTSITRVRSFEAQYFATSHGMRIYNREQFLEKLDKFEKHFDTREAAILESLQQGGQTAAELAALGIIYRRSTLIDPLRVYFAERMIEKHLEDLLSRGLVVHDGDRYHLSTK